MILAEKEKETRVWLNSLVGVLLYSRPTYLTPHSAASHLGLYCLLKGISSKNEKIMPDSPNIENGLIQITTMGNPICLKWVKEVKWMEEEHSVFS